MPRLEPGISVKNNGCKLCKCTLAQQTATSLIAILDRRPVRQRQYERRRDGIHGDYLGEFAHGMDVGAAVRAGFAREEDPVVARMTAEAKAKRDAGYRELLGDEKYRQFQEYLRPGIARTFVQDFCRSGDAGVSPVFRPAHGQDACATPNRRNRTAEVLY